MTQFAGRARTVAVRGIFTALAAVGVLLSTEARGTEQATAGTMAAPQSEHTATFLGMGKVPVAGGQNGSAPG